MKTNADHELKTNEDIELKTNDRLQNSELKIDEGLQVRELFARFLYSWFGNQICLFMVQGLGIFRD